MKYLRYVLCEEWIFLSIVKYYYLSKYCEYLLLLIFYRYLNMILDLVFRICYLCYKL